MSETANEDREPTRTRPRFTRETHADPPGRPLALGLLPLNPASPLAPIPVGSRARMVRYRHDFVTTSDGGGREADP